MIGDPKIFGIGLSRTGTTSLHAALVLLGFASIHYPVEAARRWFRGDFSDDSMQEFDACLDLPTPVFFTDLDRRYPGARFILTERPTEPWLASMSVQWGPDTSRKGEQTVQRRLRNALRAAGLDSKRAVDGPTGREFRDLVRVATYGISRFNAERLRHAYEHHNAYVKAYFSDRPEKLLCLDIAGGDGWDELCRFLRLPRPEGIGTAFPRLRTPHIGDLSAVRHAEVAHKRTAMMHLVAGDRAAITKDVPDAGSPSGG